MFESAKDSFVDAIDIQGLRVIRAVADHGSITRAARELGYSQPAISQQLRKIEQRLGFAILQKNGRTMRLTEAGEVLARSAVTVASAMRAAADELSEIAGVRSGRVSIAAFPTASSTIVPTLLGRLSRRHPGMSVNFREAEPPEAIGLLYDGLVDIAITFSYPGNRADPHAKYAGAMSTLPRWRDEMVLVLPESHRFADRRAVDISLLADEPWIAGCQQCRGNLLSVCEQAGFHPAIPRETDNMVAVVNLVAAGLGVALIPRLALAAAVPPASVRVLSTAPRTYRTVNIVALADYERITSTNAVTRLLGDLTPEQWHMESV